MVRSWPPPPATRLPILSPELPEDIRHHHCSLILGHQGAEATDRLQDRRPAIIISPFAKRGVVQHERREHASIAKFCERLFGLPTMTTRDADPATDDLMSALDFTQAPRPYSDFVPPQ